MSDDMNPTFRPGGRVRLVQTQTRGTVAEPPPEQLELAPGFLWVLWDDGSESWAVEESLEVAD